MMISSSSSSFVNDEETHRVVSIYFLLFSSLLVICLILSKTLHSYPKIHSVISEASLVLMIGMIAGVLVEFIMLPNNNDDDDETTMMKVLTEEEQQIMEEFIIEDNDGTEVEVEQEGWEALEYEIANTLLAFRPTVFFLALLPPILFNSGFQLRRELFYRHIKPILLFSILGATISAFVTAIILQSVSSMGWLLVDSSSSSSSGGGKEEEETGSSSSSSSFVPTMLELLTFGSLIAATDPVSVLAIFEEKAVDPHLFYIVFGESALNDAVAIVLFRTFADVLVSTAAATTTTEFVDDDVTSDDDDNVIFNKVLAILWHFMLKAVGSPIVGMLFGFCAALIFKHVDFREFEMLELSLCMLCMYIPYILAYSLNLSGIVAIFFSGMSARRYIMPNLSEDTQETCKSIFKLASYLSEISIFLELGLSVFGFSGDLNWPFILWAFLACLLGRAMALYPLIFIYNWSLTEVLTIPPQPASDASTADVTESSRKATDEYDFAPLLGDLATLSQKGSLENLPPISDDKVNKSKRIDNNNMFSLSYGSLWTKSKGHKKKDSDGFSGNELASSSQASLKQVNPSNKNNNNNKKGPPKTRHRRIRSIRMMPQQSIDKKITWNMAHVLWFAGVRGAVAYACVREFPNIYGHSDDFIGATMIIVLVTIIVLGGATEHLLHWFNIEMGVNEKEYMDAWHRERQLGDETSIFHSFEENYVFHMAVRQQHNQNIDGEAKNYG